MTNEKTPDNLELWNQLADTPQEWLGPYKANPNLTCVKNAYFTIRKATELWGPVGKDWGWHIDSLQVEVGHVWIAGHLFYPGPGGEQLEVPFANSWPIGDDAAKACLTDAVTKSLSYIGMHADLFLGQRTHKVEPEKKERPKQKRQSPKAKKAIAQAFSNELDDAAESLIPARVSAIKQSYKDGLIVESDMCHLLLKALLMQGNRREYDVKLEEHSRKLSKSQLASLDLIVQSQDVL